MSAYYFPDHLSAENRHKSEAQNYEDREEEEEDDGEVDLGVDGMALKKNRNHR